MFGRIGEQFFRACVTFGFTIYVNQTETKSDRIFDRRTTQFIQNYAHNISNKNCIYLQFIQRAKKEEKKT